ncbi:MAG: hypothetical protein QW666_02715 [Candidatus Woesearchaeota archaeon]
MSEDKDLPKNLEDDAVIIAESIMAQRRADMRSPGVYAATEVSFEDKLRKMYFAIKRDLPSDNNNLRHALDSVGTSLELGPMYRETVAVLLKSVYNQVKIDAVKAKISDMYFAIKGVSLEKKEN